MRPEGMMRVGTRKSPLAQAQTARVLAKLAPGAARKVLIESAGDLDATRPLHAMDRPGAFTSVLTDAILDGRIDAAVHSLKDLPVKAPSKAPIVAILPRDDPADLLVHRLDAADPARPLGLKAGSRVGTSAPRRQTQALAADPDVVPLDVRGNVGTRLKLIEAGVLDALLVARAAFERMPLALPPGCDARRLDPREFPAGPGQGAIAVQARAGSAAARLLATLDDAATREAVTLERDVLSSLGGGCGMPLGAYAHKHESTWQLHTTLASDGWEGAHIVPLQRAHVEAKTASGALRRTLRALQAKPRDQAAPRASRVLLLTLSTDAAEAYAAPLARAGWAVRAWPLLTDSPTRAPAPSGASSARWLAVASPRAAPYTRRFLRRNAGPMPRIGALGPATARALRREGLPVHVVSPEGTGAGLADAIAAFPSPPSAVLLPQAEDALPDLAEGLAKHGFAPLTWTCYRTRPAHPPPSTPRRADALVLASPSNVTAYLAHPRPPKVPLIAFGRTTEAAMRERGLVPRATMRKPTAAALIEVLS